MQYTSQVGVMDGPGHGRQESCRSPGVRSELGQMLGQISSLDQLHAVIAETPMDTDLIDRHDVGVVKLGDRLRLVAEPLYIGLGRAFAGPDDLEGDSTVQAPLSRAVHDSHAATRDLAEYLVIPHVAELDLLRRGERLLI